MTGNSDPNYRRILNFPAVHPCEGISPATLLESLITLSHNICNFRFKFLASQRRNARETIRQVSIHSIFLEEIRDQLPNISESIILFLSELHITFQKIEFLLEDCSREGAKTLILMKSYSAAEQFRSLIRSLATALDVLSLDSMEVSEEIKEVVEMVAKQGRKGRMEVDAGDESAMKRVILVLNQFENRFEPDRFMIRQILGYLDIRSWGECHREIMYLEQEIQVVDEREMPFLSNLIGLLSYCRGVLFEDYDVRLIDQTDGSSSSSSSSSNVQLIGCLNLEDFRCPISLELMTDPVTVSTGQTYDRVSIEKWLKSGNFVCPKTGEKLRSTELVPNTSLKKLIQQLCAEYGVSMAKSSKNSRDISRTILPGSPANAAAIKFLSEFLTLSIGYGTDQQKKKAAYEIRLLAKSNVFNRCCLIESGSIPPLLELLDSSHPTMQENAISALLKLSKQPRGKKSITENGLNSVLAVLKHGIKPESRQIAAATIFYLSSTHDHRKKIGENRETIPSLLELIREGKKNAVVALFALLFYHRNREKAIAAGAVPLLLGLLEKESSSSDRTEDLKTDTLAVVSTLAHSLDGSIQILQASAMPLILRLLYCIETRAGKEYCVSILHSLCLNCGADAVSVLAKDASLMTTLYSLLTDGTSHAGRKARSLIKILHRFCETSSSDLNKAITVC